MPPERTLTDADIVAITESLQKAHCSCPFNFDEVSGLRDLLVLMKETRSNIVRAAVGIALTAFAALLILGLKVWAKQ